jgi:hypothetical protein
MHKLGGLRITKRVPFRYRIISKKSSVDESLFASPKRRARERKQSLDEKTSVASDAASSPCTSTPSTSVVVLQTSDLERIKACFVPRTTPKSALQLEAEAYLEEQRAKAKAHKDCILKVTAHAGSSDVYRASV